MDRHVINMIAKKAADECVKSAFDLNSIIEHIKGMFGGGNIDIKDIMPYLGAAMPLFKGVGGLAGLPGVAGLLDLARGGANMRTLTAGAGVQAAPSNGAQPPTPPPPQTAKAITNSTTPPVATAPPTVSNAAAATPLPGQPDPYPGAGASWAATNAWNARQAAKKPANVPAPAKQPKAQLPKASFFDFMNSSGPRPGASPPGSPGPSALRIKPIAQTKPLGG